MEARKAQRVRGRQEQDLASEMRRDAYFTQRAEEQAEPLLYLPRVTTYRNRVTTWLAAHLRAEEQAEPRVLLYLCTGKPMYW